MAQIENETPRYSVVVPVYESDHSVVELVERLETVFQQTVRAPYEVILVDDGSKSPVTWPTLIALTKNHRHVSAIRLMRNYGKPSAVLCGLQRARGRWIITLDDDLQQRPEDIPAMIEHQQHDVVVASFAAKQHSPLTRSTSWIKSQFDRVILGLPCKMSPLKLFKAEVARGMLQVQTPRPFIPAMMSYVTDDFFAVTLPHQASRHGKSRYSLWKRFRQFSNLLIGNSSLLLRLVGLFGGAAALVGFGFALYVVGRKLFGSPVEPGWASLMVINLTLGGLILLVLGVIGEYLLRILEGTTRKPPYLVRMSTERETPHRLSGPEERHEPKSSN